VVERGKGIPRKDDCLHRGSGPDAYQAKTYCWTEKLNKEDDGIDKHWVLLAVVKR
jgi:hypothetical protein